MRGERRHPRQQRVAAQASDKKPTADLTRQCPDCGAVPVKHKIMCRVLIGVTRAVQGDAHWFKQHPGRRLRERRITPAEQTEVEMTLGWRPTGVVTVIQTEPGKRVRYVTRRAA